MQNEMLCRSLMLPLASRQWLMGLHHGFHEHLRLVGMDVNVSTNVSTGHVNVSEVNRNRAGLLIATGSINNYCIPATNIYFRL
jgi:hypothetical protein